MDLFENYEKELQLAVDTATKKVRQLTSVTGERRKIILQEIDAEIENIRDLMDNMRHVARNSRGSDAMNVRIKDYDRKVDVLTRELNATRNQTTRSDLMAGATGRKFGDIESQEGDQRQKILAGNQKMFEGSERLNETQRIAYESEAIGTQTIIDLKRQKDTLLRARDGLDDIDDNVTTTRKVLGAMSRRVATNNVILALIILILFATICLIVWFKWLRHLIQVPNLKLKTPQIPDLAPMTVFYLVFLSYFLVASGVVYDIISDAPAMGQVTDEVTGAQKPVVFMKYRVNGQFIYEGLAAGMLFSLGGLGFIILDKSNNKGISERDRYVLMFAGGGAIVLAYNLLIVFLRIKIPGYQG